MGETTAISWADKTFNPWIGCMEVSPACEGCYARVQQQDRYHRAEWGGPGRGVGTRVRTSAGNWHQPVRWNKKAAEAGTRPLVFCASLADVFDNQVPTAWRTDLFELIRSTPRLVWLLLTKRPQNIVRHYGAAFDMSWPRNAAIGTTVEDQLRFDTNVLALREAKRELDPAFAFLSCEPLLGPVAGDLSDIDWVITGGETDQGSHKARLTHPDWFRSLRDQCAAAGIAYHHKQNGEWVEAGEDELPERFTDPACDDFRCVSTCGFIGNLSIGSAFLHKPRSYPECFPLGEDGDATCSSVFMRKIGKHRSGRLLDGVEHNARPEITK